MTTRASKLFAILSFASALGLQACGSPNLHPSFGQLYRDINMAQLSAHPAREPTVRGTEIQTLIGRHDTQLTGDASSGGGGAGAGSNKTAGVPPLH